MPAVAPDTIYNRKHSLADLESFVDSAFNDFRASVEDQIVTCRAIREKAKPRILPVSRFLPDEGSLTRLEEALDIRCKEQADQWTRRVSRQLDRQDTEEQQVQCVSTETFKAFDFSWDLSIVDRPTAIGATLTFPGGQVTKEFTIKPDPSNGGEWLVETEGKESANLVGR